MRFRAETADWTLLEHSFAALWKTAKPKNSNERDLDSRLGPSVESGKNSRLSALLQHSPAFHTVNSLVSAKIRSSEDGLWS